MPKMTYSLSPSKTSDDLLQVALCTLPGKVPLIDFVALFEEWFPFVIGHAVHKRKIEKDVDLPVAKSIHFLRIYTDGAHGGIYLDKNAAKCFFSIC